MVTASRKGANPVTWHCYFCKLFCCTYHSPFPRSWMNILLGCQTFPESPTGSSTAQPQSEYSHNGPLYTRDPVHCRHSWHRGVVVREACKMNICAILSQRENFGPPKAGVTQEALLLPPGMASKLHVEANHCAWRLRNRCRGGYHQSPRYHLHSPLEHA